MSLLPPGTAAYDRRRWETQTVHAAVSILMSLPPQHTQPTPRLYVTYLFIAVQKRT